MFVCNTPYFLNIRGCGSVGHGIWPLLFEGNPFILSFQALCKIISISNSWSCESFSKPFAMLIWGNKDPVTKTLVQESGTEYLELCVKWVYHYLKYICTLDVIQLCCLYREVISTSFHMAVYGTLSMCNAVAFPYRRVPHCWMILVSQGIPEREHQEKECSLVVVDFRSE